MAGMLSNRRHVVISRCAAPCIWLLCLVAASLAAEDVARDPYAEALEAGDYPAALRIALIRRNPVEVCRVDLQRAARRCREAEDKLEGPLGATALSAADEAHAAYQRAAAVAKHYAALGLESVWNDALDDKAFAGLLERIEAIRRKSAPLDEVMAKAQLQRQDVQRADDDETYALGCHLVDRGRIDDALQWVFTEGAGPDPKASDATARARRVWDATRALLLHMQRQTGEPPNIYNALEAKVGALGEWFLPLACRAGRLSAEARWLDTDFVRLGEMMDGWLPNQQVSDANRLKARYERLLLDRMHQPLAAESAAFSPEDATLLERGNAWWYAAELWLTLGSSNAAPADWQAGVARARAQLPGTIASLEASADRLNRRPQLTWSSMLPAPKRYPMLLDPVISTALDDAERVDRLAEQEIERLLAAGNADAALGVAQQAKMLRVGVSSPPITGAALDAALKLAADGKPYAEVFLEYFCGTQRAWLFVKLRDGLFAFGPTAAYLLADSPDTLRQRLWTPGALNAQATNAEFAWAFGSLANQSLIVEALTKQTHCAIVAPDGPLCYLPLAVSLPSTFKDLYEVTYVASGAVLGGPSSNAKLDDVFSLWKLEAVRAPAVHASFDAQQVDRNLTPRPKGDVMLRLWGDDAADVAFLRPFAGKQRAANSLGADLTEFQRASMSSAPIEVWARYIVVRQYRQ